MFSTPNYKMVYYKIVSVIRTEVCSVRINVRRFRRGFIILVRQVVTTTVGQVMNRLGRLTFKIDCRRTTSCSKAKLRIRMFSSSRSHHQRQRRRTFPNPILCLKLPRLHLARLRLPMPIRDTNIVQF